MARKKGKTKKKQCKSYLKTNRKQTRRRHYGGNFFKNRCTQKQFDENGPETYQKICCQNKWFNRYNFYNRDSTKREERCRIASSMINEKNNKIKEENNRLREDKIKQAYLKRDKYLTNKKLMHRELFNPKGPSYAIVEGILNEGLNPRDGFAYDEGLRSTDFMSALFSRFNLQFPTGKDPSEVYSWNEQENKEKIINLIKIANLLVSKGYKIGDYDLFDNLEYGEYLKVWYIKNKFPEEWKDFIKYFSKSKNYIEMMESQWQWLDENIGKIEGIFK